MTRLWHRGDPLDERIASFTVGRDPELDSRLLRFDALASAAHACMLQRIGILSEEDARVLKRELKSIVDDAAVGAFQVRPEDEDGHTAIENRLTEQLGEVGRRIHTGRSRNDQVLAMLRLFGRWMILQHLTALFQDIERLLHLAQEHNQVAVAGYSHSRQAMPTTLGHLFAAHADCLMDVIPWYKTAFDHINRSPLGSASGFGVALPLDRRLVAELLGFQSVQGNTLAVQNDRGKAEYLLLGVSATAITDLSRLAGDLIWLSADEIAIIKLDVQVTTGSSIMPQKRNPDVLELVRATAARLRGRQAEIGGVYGSLPSGYHRDLQLTKEPFVEGMQSAYDALVSIRPVLDSLEVDPDRGRQLLLRSTGATDAVYDRVRTGQAFRDAYREVAAAPESFSPLEPADTWRTRTHLGAPGDQDLTTYHHTLIEHRAWLAQHRQQEADIWKLLGE